MNARLPGGLVAATRALLGAVSSGDAAAKGKKGGVGALTQEQNTRLAQLNKWISRARQTAGLAFKNQDVKLHERFQVGVNEPNDLASILQRGRIIVASIKKADNLAALKAKGWLDADTTAFDTAIADLAGTDTTQETGKGDAKDATGARNRSANALYDSLLTIQNAAGLEWPAEDSANACVREACSRNMDKTLGVAGRIAGAAGMIAGSAGNPSSFAGNLTGSAGKAAGSAGQTANSAGAAGHSAGVRDGSAGVAHKSAGVTQEFAGAMPHSAGMVAGTTGEVQNFAGLTGRSTENLRLPRGLAEVAGNRNHIFPIIPHRHPN